MSSIKNIDELLRILKEARPQQKNAEEATDKIVRCIKAIEKPVTGNRKIALLRSVSITAAAAVISLFIKQTWYDVPQNEPSFGSHSQVVWQAIPAPSLKKSAAGDLLPEGLKYLHQKQKEAEERNIILHQYWAVNINITNNHKIK